MRRIFFLVVGFLNVLFFARALFPQERDFTGAALSDAVSSKLEDAGFAPEFFFVTDERDGFPYTVTVTFPATRADERDGRQNPDTLVIAAVQYLSYMDGMIEFMTAIGATERAFDVRFAFTANDISAIDGSWTLNGTKRLLEAIEDAESPCVVLLAPDESLNDPPARFVPVSTLAENITLTPLWLAKALPFKARHPFFVYRLNLIKTDGRLEFLALNDIPSALVAFNPRSQAALFDGLTRFIDSLSDTEQGFGQKIDFSRTEGNYIPIPNPLGEMRLFIGEKLYICVFLPCVLVSLAALCVFPSVFCGIASALLVLSAIDPSFFAPALVAHLFLSLAGFAKERAAKTVFASCAALVVLSCASLPFFIRVPDGNKNERAIREDESASASLKAGRMDFLEHESVILTASAALPIVRCDISVATPGASPLYGSIFPVTIGEDFTARFKLEEYPPNPLVMRYLTSKRQDAVITADFFLDAGDGEIVTKRVRTELTHVPPR